MFAKNNLKDYIIILFLLFCFGCQIQPSTGSFLSDVPFIFEASGIFTNAISIKWHDNSSHESGYIIERSMDKENFAVIKAINISNVESYMDTNLAPGTTYYYRVCADYSGKKSSYSNIKEARTIGTGTLIDQTAVIPGYPDHVSVEIPQNLPDIDSVINAPSHGLSVYGIYTWYNHFNKTGANFINETKNVGWGSMRAGANDEQFSGISGDNAMTGLLDLDCDILLTFCGTSSRNRSVFGLPLFDSGCDPGDSNFISDYTNYVDRILSRYGPHGSFFTNGVPYKPIRYVEIWNEPNEHYLFYNSSIPGSENVAMVHKAKLYAKLLMAAYKHIKDKWTNEINVVGLSVCGVSRNDISWGYPGSYTNGFIEMVHQYIQQFGGNPAQCYDILSDHPYSHIAPPDAECYPLNRTGYHYSVANSFAAYKKIMSDYGNAGKPVWFTEDGWGRDYGRYPAGANSIPERIQAAYVVRLYLMALRLGVETVHIMFMFDEVSNNGFFNYYTHQWYESAYAVQNMIKIMPKPKIINAVHDGTNCYYAYTFQPNIDAPGNPVIVAWNVIGPTNVSIPCANDTYKVIDMLGNCMTITVSSGVINIETGPYPVYITKN